MTYYPVHIPDLPSGEQIDRLVAVTEPLARITQPKVYGIDHIPEGGSLLVGNHTIYGFLDLPFMMAEIWKRRRLAIRGLGEHAHYLVPVWRDLLGMCGMVRGTRDTCAPSCATARPSSCFPAARARSTSARARSTS